MRRQHIGWWLAVVYFWVNFTFFLALLVVGLIRRDIHIELNLVVITALFVEIVVSALFLYCFVLLLQDNPRRWKVDSPTKPTE